MCLGFFLSIKCYLIHFIDYVLKIQLFLYVCENLYIWLSDLIWWTLGGRRLAISDSHHRPRNSTNQWLFLSARAHCSIECIWVIVCVCVCAHQLVACFVCWESVIGEFVHRACVFSTKFTVWLMTCLNVDAEQGDCGVIYTWGYVVFFGKKSMDFPIIFKLRKQTAI